MADGLIKIDIEVDGKKVVAASKELDGLEASAIKSGDGAKKASDNINNLGNASKNASGGVKGTADSLSNMGKSADDAANSTKKAAQEALNMGNESGRASMSIKDIAVSLGLVAVAAAAFNVLKASLDGAISRFDTLQSFPVIMEKMGFSSEQAKGSVEKLSEGIQGLPTTLDGIVTSAKSIALLTGDLDVATDTALSLNNAFLASGSSAVDAERGLTQYVQMLSKGSVDMQSWRTLQETMGYALNETAKAFGFTGKAAQNDLYKALKDGDITFDAFNNKIIELNGGVGGFAEVAKSSSAGISTSMSNLKNAVVVGIANMITSFDKLSQEVTGKSIAENMDGLKVVVGASFKFINSTIESATPVVKTFADTVSAATPIVKTLSPAIIGLVAAYAAYTVITKASAAIEASSKIMGLASAAQKGLTLATNAQITSAVAEAAITEAINIAKQKNIVLTHAEKVAIAQKAVADKAATVASAAELGLVSAKSVAMGVLTGQITLTTAAIAIKTAATYAWGVAIKFLLGPIGWITAGIALLVTGVIAVVKWFNKSTEEGERLAGVTDTLADSTNALNDSVNGTADAFERNKSGIESTAVANADLVTKIEELLAVENKSSAHKKELQSYVDSLNGSVEGLSLAYSKEANTLNMTSEEIAAKIALMKEQDTLIASQERFLEISKEQNEAEMKLKEINELRAEWNAKLEEGSVKAKEHKVAIADLDEQEKALKVTIADLAEQHGVTEAQITAAIEGIANATDESVNDQVEAYEFLKDHIMDIVDSLKSTWEDYKKQATDMFDRLSEKSKVSVSEMTKNLEENQRIMGEWATNIAKLAERGIDEGLLDTLRTAGPKSAGHVNALVKASDEELQKLSNAFSKGGETATKALSTSLGVENAVVMDSVGHLITQTGDTLNEQIKKANFESIGGAIPEGAAKGIEKGTKDVTDATKAMAVGVEKEFTEAMRINSPSKVFEDRGGNITDGAKLGIEKGTPAVIQTTKELAKSMIEQFKDIKADFIKIGSHMAEGIDVGLKDGSAKVMATARNLANSITLEMRKALDIHSPSRVTRTIGNETGEGLNLGIKDKQAAVNATSKKMADSVASIIKQMHSSIKDDTSKHNEEIKAVERRAKEDINIINAKATKAKRALTQAEAVKISRITEDANKKIAAIEEKAGKEREKIAADNSKALIEIAEKYVKEKTAAGEMSLKEEGYFWNEMKRSAQVGSVEYEKALQNHQNVVKQMRSDMEKTNESYAKRITDIDKKLVDDTRKLNDEYNQAYSSRVNDLLNLAGLLDEFVEREAVSGQKLIANMQSQVTALQEFSTVIASLGGRIDNDALFEELQALGPKSLAELRALNSMSDSELQVFTDLYETRFELARNQAKKELEPLKEDIAQQIRDLNVASQKELEIVEAEWKNAIKKIVFGAKKEFDSMNQVGKDAIKGLENGMMAMEPALMATAKRIADSIKSTIKSALDIHSPSRVMRDEVGRWIPQGIALGIRDNAKAVYAELENMAGKMIIPATPEQALGTSRMAYSGGVFSRGGSITSSTDNRKTFAPKITNHFTPAESTPSQAAREQNKMLRKLGTVF